MSQANVTSGQELADALANFWQTQTPTSAQLQGPADTTLLLSAPLVSLAGVNLTPLPSYIVTSLANLNIRGQTATSTVLDLASRTQILPSAPGKVLLYDMLILNTCHRLTSWGFIITQASLVYNLNRTSQSNVMYTENTVMTTTQSHVSAALYFGLMTLSSFPAAVSMTAIMMNGDPPVTFESYQYSADSLTYTFHGLTWSCLNCTITAWDSLHYPQLNSLRDAGTLKPPRYCNGTLVEENAAPGTFLPGFLSDDDESLSTALLEAARCTTRPGGCTLVGTPVLVSLLKSASLASVPRPVPLGGELFMIAGLTPLVDTIMDLGGLTGFLAPVPATQLLVGRLTLTGLATQSLGSTNTWGSMTSSALPLWALRSPNSTASPINLPTIGMEIVTMVLPQEDFAIMMAFALLQQTPGCSVTPASLVSPSSLAAMQVMSGIQVFQLSSPIPADHQSLRFSWFQGWGINATTLTFIPEQPLNLGLVQSLTLTNSPACSSFQQDLTVNAAPSSHKLALAVGLGVGLGGAFLILVGVLIAAYMIRASRRASASRTQSTSIDKNQAYGNIHTASKSLDCTAANKDVEHTASLSKPGSELTSEATHSPLSGFADHLCSYHQSNLDNLHAAAEKATRDKKDDNALLHKEVAKVSAALEGNAANKVFIIAPLGQGGSGQVYLGRWKGMACAVKIVTVHDTTRPDRPGPSPRDRAITEAAVAVSVSHRHVVATYHYDIKSMREVPDETGLQRMQSGEADPTQADGMQLLLIMELCEVSLAMCLSNQTLINTDTGLPELELVLPIMLHISLGLEYLHSKNIVHGDIKPDNVLISYRVTPGSTVPFIAKLSDFGTSAVLDGNASHLSFHGAGTPAYIAPEVANHARLSPAADVFSLGVLFWQLLHNQTPDRRSEQLMLPAIHEARSSAALHPNFTTQTEDQASPNFFIPSSLEPCGVSPGLGEPALPESGCLPSPQCVVEEAPSPATTAYPAFAAHVPAALVDICGRCLATNPRSRPEVQALVHEFQLLIKQYNYCS